MPTKKEALCFREFLMGRNLWYRSTGGEQPHGSSSPHTTHVRSLTPQMEQLQAELQLLLQVFISVR